MKHFEVLGIDFDNKGALLMLSAIAEWVGSAYPGSRLVMDWRVPFARRGPYSVWGKLGNGRGNLMDYGRYGHLLPGSLRHRLGLVADREIDVVLDASGYAYGDSWGAVKAEQRMANHVVEWRRAGRKIILLPQAFGPFKDIRLQQAMRTVCEHAHLIFARDDRSMTELQGVVDVRSIIRQAPDFTINVKGRPFAGMETLAGGIGLIPNHKMFEKGGEREGDYMQFFRELVEGALAQGRRVIWIVHEGARDAAICTEINKQISRPLPVIDRSDPRETKMVIKQCAGIVTSRFHGFASALYQGVPAVATSWNHKYEELARDYGVPELVQARPNAAEALDLLSSFIDGGRGEAFRTGTSSVVGRHIAAINDMWAQVRAEIERA